MWHQTGLVVRASIPEQQAPRISINCEPRQFDVSSTINRHHEDKPTPSGDDAWQAKQRDFGATERYQASHFDPPF
jgi:hypothetical protein